MQIQNNLEKKTLKPILVTGGTGFLGKAIAKALAKEGCSVRVLGRSACPEELSFSDYRQGDLLDKETVLEAVSGCRAVFHCAGEKKDVSRMQAVNVEGTQNFFRAASKEEGMFFLHMSSVGVMGKTHKKKVDEDEPCSPMNLYEKTKWEAEKIVLSGLEKGSTVILRPTNVFDAPMFQNLGKGSFLEKMRFYLRGREKAHWVYLDNVVAAALYLFQHFKKKTPETFIISADEEEGNTVGEIYACSQKKDGDFPSKKRIYPPLIFPWFFRVCLHGRSNWGDITYSSKRLFRSGFQMPYSFSASLKHAGEKKE